MTNKQKMFVEEYMIDLCQTKAAIRAGYSPLAADQIGNENMKKPEIKAAIERALAEKSRRTGVNADRITLEAARLAFANIGNICNFADGTLLDGVSEDDLAAVASVKVRHIPSGEGFILEREVKLHDKTKNLELLAKLLGLMNNSTRLETDVSIIMIDDIRE